MNFSAFNNKTETTGKKVNIITAIITDLVLSMSENPAKAQGCTYTRNNTTYTGTKTG
jgi:hypothetical protein